MVALDPDHGAARSVRRHAERVGLALDHERRDLDGVELAEAALRGIVALPGRVDREREAEDGGGFRLGRGSAGDAGAGGTAAGDDREALERVRAEVRDRGEPRRVELARPERAFRPATR